MVTYAVILAVCPVCFIIGNALFMFILVRMVGLFCLESFRDVREQIMRDGKQVCHQRGVCVCVYLIASLGNVSLMVVTGVYDKPLHLDCSHGTTEGLSSLIYPYDTVINGKHTQQNGPADAFK